MNCLDAETLAAWFDGGLKGAALEDARAHVAGCARCQMLLGAMGQTRAAVPAPQPERAPRRWLAWAVPVAAAATAIAVWVAIPEQRNVAVVTPAPLAEQREAAPGLPAPPAETRQEASAPPAAPSPVPRAQRNGAPAETGAIAAAPPPPPAPTATPEAAAPAAEPPAAAPPLAPRPEARVLDQQQRAAAAAASRKDAGATAQAPLAETVTLAGETPQAPTIDTLCGPRWRSAPESATGAPTAGSSPSANVCWVVGRGGAVWRSTDGQAWQRIAFPETTDLSGVRASDARSAIVSTADGRSFGTSDGGLTWTRR